MKILGIDPGLATIGLGLIEVDTRRPKVLEWLTIETATGLALADRLREIQEDLLTYLRDQKPNLVVVEKLFFATNVQTAIDVAQARGVIIAQIATEGIDLIEPTPLQLKSCIAGDGSASKSQIQEMVMRELQLEQKPTPDDAADGLALALFGAFTKAGMAIA